MVSLNFNLALLNILAKLPERRATYDEVTREIEIIIVNEDQTEQLKRFSALGDIDIFQSGLVSRDEEGLQITDEGLSLLQSLERSSESSPDVSSAPALQPFRLIDHLIGREERLKIFNLEIRTLEGGADEDSDLQWEEENRSVPIEMADAALEASAANLPVRVDSQDSDEAGNGSDDQLAPDGSNGTIATGPASQNAPAFLRRSFGSKVQEPTRRSSRVSVLFAFIATKKRFLFDHWRRHFAQDISAPKTERFVQGAGGAAFAFLSLVVVVTCLGAAIALGQIKSLKSDIAMLHREILPLRERLERLEQAEKTKLNLDQQEGRQDVSGAEKIKAGVTRNDQTALILSRDEIQLIRDYIKPAPSAGNAPAISVGDPVGSATIPLPSPLTEKIPRLLGARFTTRGGTIIIVKKDSRQADAVLAAN